MEDDFYNAFADAGLVAQDPFSGSYSDSSGNTPSPLNLGNLGKGLSLGSSILGGFGAMQIGNEEAGAYEYNANLALEQEKVDLDKLSREETILGGEQRAGYLKAGVTLSGSALDVMVQSASQVELDKQITHYNAQSKADMYNYEAQVAKNQGKFKMGESLLSGGIGLLGLL